MKRLMTILILTMATICCTSRTRVDNSTVPALDLNRYIGRWYEIARFDHSFERNVEFATANYTVQPNGKIKVVNSGIRDGESRTSVGKAKITSTPGLLRVSFFGPFYSDYRVMMISPDYKYALVGSKSDGYLWILSRTPVVPDDMLNAILSEAQNRGYDIDKLIWVRQTP